MQKEIRPWGFFEMDEATLLPVAPEGMFFRVMISKTSPKNYWYVQLRKKTWYGSRKVADRIFNFHASLLTRENVLRGAAYLLENYVEPEKKNDFSLLGNYPPKSL